jgi:hypothetical protein
MNAGTGDGFQTGPGSPDRRRGEGSDSTQAVSGLLDGLETQTRGREQVCVRDVFQVMDRRSYGPLLLLPGVLAVSPIGAIPGMSILTGALIALISGQALWGRSMPWVPKKLLTFSFPRSKFVRGRHTAQPWIGRAERLVKHRLNFMANPVVFRLGALMCLLLSMSFFPLSLVPMGVAIPGTAIILFAFGWTDDDGALIAAAFATTHLWPF